MQIRFLDALAKLRTATALSSLSARPSVLPFCPHGLTRLPQDGFT